MSNQRRSFGERSSIIISLKCRPAQLPPPSNNNRPPCARPPSPFLRTNKSTTKQTHQHACPDTARTRGQLAETNLQAPQHLPGTRHIPNAQLHVVTKPVQRQARRPPGPVLHTLNSIVSVRPYALSSCARSQACVSARWRQHTSASVVGCPKHAPAPPQSVHRVLQPTNTITH